MAKICLAFWSLCCMGEISGWNLRGDFVPEVKGDSEKPESSEQAPPSTKALQAPPSSFPLDSWNHPSPTEQISFQDKLSQKRCGLLPTPFMPSPWFCNTTEGRRRGNPAWISGSASSHMSQVCQHQATVRSGAQIGQRSLQPAAETGNHQPSSFCSCPSLLQPGHLSTSTVESRSTPGFPDSSAREEASKGLGGSSLCISPH